MRRIREIEEKTVEKIVEEMGRERSEARRGTPCIE